jgi:patatin-like phospholipase/acyl hydrolase
MSMKRILSIDGGGIRGMIPALVLAEIERKTGRPIAAQFDLLAGTSTGGIICLGLAKDNGQGEPLYSAQDMVVACFRARSGRALPLSGAPPTNAMTTSPWKIC